MKRAQVEHSDEPKLIYFGLCERRVVVIMDTVLAEWLAINADRGEYV